MYTQQQAIAPFQVLLELSKTAFVAPYNLIQTTNVFISKYQYQQQKICGTHTRAGMSLLATAQKI